MRTYAAFCDLCLGEGKTRLATATYWNDEGEEWHACATHLKDVQQTGLDYEQFDEPGDME